MVDTWIYLVLLLFKDHQPFLIQSLRRLLCKYGQCSQNWTKRHSSTSKLVTLLLAGLVHTTRVCTKDFTRGNSLKMNGQKIPVTKLRSHAHGFTFPILVLLLILTRQKSCAPCGFLFFLMWALFTLQIGIFMRILGPAFFFNAHLILGGGGPIRVSVVIFQFHML